MGWVVLVIRASRLKHMHPTLHASPPSRPLPAEPSLHSRHTHARARSPMELGPHPQQKNAELT